MHIVILFSLPVRWSAIRGEFRKRLESKLMDELRRTYLPIPAELAATIADEKKQAEYLMTETQQVADWLSEREQAAQIRELYGR